MVEVRNLIVLLVEYQELEDMRLIKVDNQEMCCLTVGSIKVGSGSRRDHRR